MKHSAEVREAAVRKALTRAAPQRDIAREFGISVTTVQNWLRQHRHNGGVAMAERVKRPQDWTGEERLQALIETAGLSEPELGKWCRGRGLHSHHLLQWRRELAAGRPGDQESRDTLRALREENRETCFSRRDQSGLIRPPQQRKRQGSGSTEAQARTS